MVDTNYMQTIIKVLETPKKKRLSDEIWFTQFRAQLPDTGSKITSNQDTQLVHLQFWGTLAEEIENICKINDYVLVEGYLSFRIKQTQNPDFEINMKKDKRMVITGLKVYSLYR